MNIEVAYVRKNNNESISEIIERRLCGALEDLRIPDGIDIPDSYEVFLANNEKRKVAVSAPVNGWITVIESKEVNDYAMLFEISKELQTEVIAIVQSGAIGAWGYVKMKSGEVVQSRFSEEDDDIEGLIEDFKTSNGITEPFYLFREAIQRRTDGWLIIQRHN